MLFGIDDDTHEGNKMLKSVWGCVRNKLFRSTYACNAKTFR